MGAFAAVAQGAGEEPQLITIRHEPAGRRRSAARHRRQGRDVRLRRLLDQARRAHARDEVRHVRRRGGARGDRRRSPSSGCRCALVTVIGATENMVAARAVRPGDIVRAKAGITIEVNNTDAEGRLVLADCLTHARDQGAERLIDLATLTGGIVTTFGPVHAGLMGNDDELVRRGRRRRRGDRRARLAAAARPGVRRADQGPLRRPHQLERGPQGAVDHGRRVARSASPATCRGRTSTSRAWRTPSAARTRRRARRAGACGCWSSSPAPRPPDASPSVHRDGGLVA